VTSIPERVELAILVIPENSVEETIRACAEKGVKGITIITAGFGEVTQIGRGREEAMARVAKSYGMRILGPNVSGTFNLRARFNAKRSHSKRLVATPLAGVSQGGYAFADLLAVGEANAMGVGKFVHTGNECDLQVTDFLEHFGKDPQVMGILMNSVFLDLLDHDAMRMQRLNQLIAHLPEDQRHDLKQVKLLTLRPSADLGKMAGAYEADLPRAFRFLTRGLGTKETRSPDFLSLVLFQPEYLRTLIELGEKDAEARCHEIEAFLLDPS